jgi:hypothetical protein
MPRSAPAIFVRHLAVDVVGTFLYFPLWWYGPGLVAAAAKAGRFVAYNAESFGVRHWVKNLFRPMYGLRDWQGRLISFFARLIAIIWYSFLLILLSGLAFAAFVAYLVWPLVAVVALWRQFTDQIPPMTMPSVSLPI